MADLNDPLVQTCTSCGTLIDISDQEPFALIHCPNCGTSMRVSRGFDNFELQEVLGAGGMGTVYRALDTNLNRFVALKLLRPEYSANPEFVRKFQVEAAITASINHTHVVKVYSSGEDHGLIYLAMELVDKGSLDDLMTLQGRVAESQVLEVGLQIAQGLQAAYQRGLIHRDIKPGNILFSDAHTAKIVDFGLAVFMDQVSEVKGDVWGTPYYVAPEKLDNQPEDVRSDIYSLGATLFHAVAGRPPFEAETASMVALKHVKSQVVSLKAFAPDVSSATAYVINKTLNKEREQRYQNYDELIEHLEYARSQLLDKIDARQKSRVVVEGDEDHKAMSWITFGMIALIVLSGVLVYTFWDTLTKRTDAPPPRAQQARQATGGDIGVRVEAARNLIVGGKIADATAAFRAFEEEPNIPQPMRNWITLQLGLVEWLGDRDRRARDVFKRIEDRGLYSTDPSEQELAKFFVNLATELRNEKPTTVADAKDYDRFNHQAIALFLLALKNWQLGSFEHAGPLFTQFDHTKPAAPHEWIGAYKTAASPFMADYAEFRSASENLEAADTSEKIRQAVREAKAARSRFKQAGKLAAKLDALIADRDAKLEIADEQMKQKAAEQRLADANVLRQLKPKVLALCRQHKFGEARQMASTAEVASDAGRRGKDALIKYVEWLAKYKVMLIQDLSSGSYPHPVGRKSGTPLAGGVRKASEQQIDVRTPYGSQTVLWADVTPESCLQMGQFFNRPNLPLPAAADRKWLLGIFTVFAGQPKEGRVLLGEAAQAKPEFRDALKLFLESTETE